ncbi:MAG: TIM barrel protein [Acidimicrobiales bacterium]
MSAVAKVAGAPISWGVCEVPEWGYQMEPDRVLGEMRGLGLHATEAGPQGFLPDEPAVLFDYLANQAMTLVGGFTPLVLHHGTGWRDELEAAVQRFARCGAEVLVLASATGSEDYDTRRALSTTEWTSLLSALDLAVAIASDAGLRAVLHPHVGTVVQRPDEIERVLAGTSVPLCLDTGHIMAGGGDPAALARAAADRITHVHLKDVDAEIAQRVADGGLAYSTAVRNGLYCPLGDGDVNVQGIVSSLDQAGYDGWYVLEQDVMLDAAPKADVGPRLAVEQSLGYLRGVLAAVGLTDADSISSDSDRRDDL